MSYTDLEPKEFKKIKKYDTRFHIKPYTNFEKNQMKQESIYKNIDKEVGKTIIELERLRQLIYNDLVAYTREQLMDQSEFFDPLYEPAVEGIDGLDFDDFDVDTLKQKVDMLIPGFDMNNRTDLLPEERSYLITNADNLQQLADFADDVQLDAEKALLFTSVLRTRLKSALTDKSLVELRSAFEEVSPEIKMMMVQPKLSKAGKEMLRDLLIRRHNDAYEQWFAEPNAAVQEKWKKTKERFDREIDNIWFDDLAKANHLLDLYFEEIRKRSIHLANIEFKNINSANRSKRGRTPKNMSTYVPNKMNKIIDEIPDGTLWKYVLEKKAKQYKY